MPTSNRIAPPAPRVVIFMTAQRASDIPCGDNSLACLLPLGTATFAERVMDSCSQAGLHEIDLVLSEHPECLRERLGDGSQWGLKLNWHLAKETATPYAVLRGMSLATGQRLLIGHGHRWLSERVLQALAQQGSVAMHAEQQAGWTGWLSVDSLTIIQSLAPYADYEALSKVALAMQPQQCLMALQREFAQTDSAADLLHAQQIALQDTSGHAVPASWRRMPWGAMSPQAIVHPQALLIGPVLVGAGCVVGRTALLGPDTVLSRDVLVAEGAVVRDALVLPNTYVGGGITLEHAVAQCNSVQNLKWSVRTNLSHADAMLTPLVPASKTGSSWSGRLLATVCAVTLLPLFAVLATLQAVRGRPWGWSSMQAVTRRDEDSGLLHFHRVRQHRPNADSAEWMLGGYGALLDVVQNRRNWFGVRPRETSQWYALGRDWQQLFSRARPGFFHAPAWNDRPGASDHETLAAADAYFAVSNNVRERLRILLALIKGSQSMRRIW